MTHMLPEPTMADVLPESYALWSRIAVWQGLWLVDGITCADGLGADRITFEDGGGNWATLVRLGADRAVLFGWDRSNKTDRDEDFEPFAGAPEWVPGSGFQRRISFAYWWEGNGWQRADGHPVDGAEACLGSLCDVEDFAGFFADAGFVLDNCDEDEEIEDVVIGIGELCVSAELGVVTRESLGFLTFAEPGVLDAMYDHLTSAGITRGARED